MKNKELLDLPKTNVIRKTVIPLVDKLLSDSQEKTSLLTALATIPDAETWPDWYDLNDKLPDEESCVLGYVPASEDIEEQIRAVIYFGHIFNNGFSPVYGDGYDFIYAMVTHWMPLPLPPKPESKDKQ